MRSSRAQNSPSEGQEQRVRGGVRQVGVRKARRALPHPYPSPKNSEELCANLEARRPFIEDLWSVHCLIRKNSNPARGGGLLNTQNAVEQASEYEGPGWIDCFIAEVAAPDESDSAADEALQTVGFQRISSPDFFKPPGVVEHLLGETAESAFLAPYVERAREHLEAGTFVVLNGVAVAEEARGARISHRLHDEAIRVALTRHFRQLQHGGIPDAYELAFGHAVACHIVVCREDELQRHLDDPSRIESRFHNAASLGSHTAEGFIPLGWHVYKGYVAALLMRLPGVEAPALEGFDLAAAIAASYRLGDRGATIDPSTRPW